MIKLEIIMYNIWCDLQKTSPSNINNLQNYIKLIGGK